MDLFLGTNAGRRVSTPASICEWQVFLHNSILQIPYLTQVLNFAIQSFSIKLQEQKIANAILIKVLCSLYVQNLNRDFKIHESRLSRFYADFYSSRLKRNLQYHWGLIGYSWCSLGSIEIIVSIGVLMSLVGISFLFTRVSLGITGIRLCYQITLQRS